MKICIAADLHLPYVGGTSQYRAFDFAVADAEKRGAELIVFAGDITADGDESAAEYFMNRMKSSMLPFLVIAGNSDLRRENKKIVPSSPVMNKFDGFRIFMVNDSDRTVDDNTMKLISSAERGDLVFIHHPLSALKEPCRSELLKWREEKPDVMLFCAHLHKSGIDGNTVSLPALDPDKAIGENPGVLYYDTETGTFEKSYFSCPMPEKFSTLYGISCYHTFEHLKFSAEHRLKSLELRPNSIDCDRVELKKLIDEWRSAGGRNLSVHFPNAVWKDGEIKGRDELLSFAEFANETGADRATMHVPRIKSDEMTEEITEKFVLLYAEFINTLNQNIVVGIENLHMSEKDRENGTRPFGCIPEECIAFVDSIRKHTAHKAGINFDLGHARNNAPYSQKYTVGAWYAEVGKYCVGYHLHQVTESKGIFENHTPITEHYGRLISLASFYDSLQSGTINTAPVIFEIRTDGGAEKTVEFFESEER